MAWIFLIVAGLPEVGWTFAMKRSEGFLILAPTVVTFVPMAGSFGLLSLAMRSLPLGTASTRWTGIGAVGSFAAGIAVLGEAASPLGILAALLILAGLVPMKLATPA